MYERNPIRTPVKSRRSEDIRFDIGIVLLISALVGLAVVFGLFG